MELVAIFRLQGLGGRSWSAINKRLKVALRQCDALGIAVGAALAFLVLNYV
ncbi:MAG TPA: hypothetical protein VHM69_09455 [Rubrobacter sp.]|nr:hypothetical protein [Rubrobacter sp.]